LTIEFDGIAPSKILDFHGAIGEALKQSIKTMEKENVEMKQIIK
jgi:hypothetical protein